MQSIKNNLGNSIDDIPIIIIGNKIDCQEREVSVEEAENFWKEQGFSYFETSAKTGENIEKTIKFLVKRVINVKEGNKDENKDFTKSIKIDKDDNNEEKKDGAKKCGC